MPRGAKNGCILPSSLLGKAHISDPDQLRSDPAYPRIQSDSNRQSTNDIIQATEIATTYLAKTASDRRTVMCQFFEFHLDAETGRAEKLSDIDDNNDRR
ncbi:unnamed protein product [Protopolystoma xenopodis]|uniref:Uncharacterized protein n=1 Tax=Protopolystoma xenopodis TaxID=117903 RepID=A0A3S5A5I4_9PLAT|nr:unnamed protein product [Protopolystoma xenopodis]